MVSKVSSPATSGSVWETDDSRVWRFYLAHYDDAIRNKAPDVLPALEHFMWHDLSNNVRSRSPSYLSAVDYRRLIDWKLQRGSFRPSLKAFARDVANDEIKACSQTAFENVAAAPVGAHRDWAQVWTSAVTPLIKIKGCGPATASAVLAAVDPSFPFMSDELLLSTIKEKKYTKKAFLDMVACVDAKIDQLSSDSVTWTARDVERVVFASMHGVPSPTEAQLKKMEKGEELEKESQPPVAKGKKGGAKSSAAAKPKSSNRRGEQAAATSKEDHGDEEEDEPVGEDEIEVKQVRASPRSRKAIQKKKENEDDQVDVEQTPKTEVRNAKANTRKSPRRPTRPSTLNGGAMDEEDKDENNEVGEDDEEKTEKEEDKQMQLGPKSRSRKQKTKFQLQTEVGSTEKDKDEDQAKVTPRKSVRQKKVASSNSEEEGADVVVTKSPKRKQESSAAPRRPSKAKKSTKNAGNGKSKGVDSDDVDMEEGDDSKQEAEDVVMAAQGENKGKRSSKRGLKATVAPGNEEMDAESKDADGEATRRSKRIRSKG